jgi:hypothetical protein
MGETSEANTDDASSMMHANTSIERTSMVGIAGFEAEADMTVSRLCHRILGVEETAAG